MKGEEQLAPTTSPPPLPSLGEGVGGGGQSGRAARRLALPTSVVVMSLLIGGLAAEIGVRLAQPVPAQDLLPLPYNHEGLRRLAAGDTYLRFDPLLGWSTGPSARGEDRGAIYRTNSAGIRSDREFGLEPASGVRRLAAFGDSFAHCDEVNNSDCWTLRLERAWAGTEVLNFGVPAFGPDQAWLRYERDGRPYHPCAVLIGYYIGDIDRVVNRFRPFYTPETSLVVGKPRFLLDRDGLSLLPNPATRLEQLDDPAWVEEALGPHDHWYFPGTFVANPFDVFVLVRLGRTAVYRRIRRIELGSDQRESHARAYGGQVEAFQVAGQVLIRFAREVEQDGAQPVVVVFGGRAELAAVQRGDKFYAPLLDWLAREMVPTIDATDALLAAARRSGGDPQSMLTLNSHYRGPGNQVVAEALARQLPKLTSSTCRSA